MINRYCSWDHGTELSRCPNAIIHAAAAALFAHQKVRGGDRGTNAVGTIFRKIFVGTRARPI